MKQRSLYSFFMEIVISLILLTIATILSLMLFSSAASKDQDSRAIAKITQRMVEISETLRSDDDAYLRLFTQASTEEKTYLYSYDVNGKSSKTSAAYQLSVYVKAVPYGSSWLRTSRLELVDIRDGSIVTGWHVSTFREDHP